MIAAISCGVRVGMLGVLLGHWSEMSAVSVVLLVVCGILIGIAVRASKD